MTISNRYPGKCGACGSHVAADAGFAVKMAGGWRCFCNSDRCLPPEAKASVENKGGPRRLTTDGFVEMVKDNAALPLLRALPGARFDWDSKRWSVSLSPIDRPRVLEIADKLKLDVAPELRTFALPGHEDAVARATKGPGYHAFPFQVEGVKWLAPRIAAGEKSLLADDMGIGKTPQTLWALPEGSKTIAIVPANVKWNWYDEAKALRPDLTPVVLSGRNAWHTPKAGEIVLTNYDILPAFLTPKKTGEKDKRGRDIKEATLPEGVDLSDCILVADESHRAKNYKAQRSQKIAELSRFCRATVFLTGTPLKNRPLDLWGVLSSGGMNWDVFGSWKGFLKCFNGFKNRWGGYEFGLPTPDAAERLRRVMLRRTKAEVLPDLPAKTYKTLRVNGISKSLKRELDKLWEEWKGFIAEGSLPPFEEFSGLRAKLAAERIPHAEALVEDYEETDTPVVVFSAHREPVEALGAREGWAKILGGTDAKERRDIVRDFQDGKLKGIALTIAAGGEGITLTKASNLIFVDLDWTPALNFQAEDRCVRIGQTAQKVLVTRLVSDHALDEHVLKLLAYKQTLMEQALDTRVEYTPKPDAPAVEVKHETEDEWNARREAVLKAASEAEQAEALDKVKSYVAAGRCNSAPCRELTDEYKATLDDATRFMLGRCDGAKTKDSVGFNKPHAAVAHTILASGLNCDDAYRLAEAILCRYHRQLHERFPAIFAA